jgi:hypothetical protein
METQWKYLDIQFIVATRDNYKKAVKLSNYHDAALNVAKNTEALLVPVYNRYHPLHLTLNLEYDEWKSAGGAQEGQTLNVKQVLAAGLAEIDIWDPQIQVLYPKTTPRYKSIFPDGRKPFNSGSITDRVNAFNTLSLNIGADVALAAIKAQVDARYIALDTAHDTQEAAKGTTKAQSAQVEVARIAAMNMQYRNLGFVMDTYFDRLEEMADMLFDQQTLRDHRQTEFTGTLDPNETKAVLVRTFLADDELKLKSNGNADIKFYLASSSGATNSTAVSVLANQEITIQISAFNVPDYGTHRFLTAVNQSNSEITQYIVEIL